MTQYLNTGGFYWDENIELDNNVVQILNFGNETNLMKYIDSYSDLLKNQIETLIF